MTLPLQREGEPRQEDKERSTTNTATPHTTESPAFKGQQRSARNVFGRPSTSPDRRESIALFRQLEDDPELLQEDQYISRHLPSFILEDSTSIHDVDLPDPLSDAPSNLLDPVSTTPPSAPPPSIRMVHSPVISVNPTNEVVLPMESSTLPDTLPDALPEATALPLAPLPFIQMVCSPVASVNSTAEAVLPMDDPAVMDPILEALPVVSILPFTRVLHSPVVRVQPATEIDHPMEDLAPPAINSLPGTPSFIGNSPPSALLSPKADTPEYEAYPALHLPDPTLLPASSTTPPLPPHQGIVPHIPSPAALPEVSPVPQAVDDAKDHVMEDIPHLSPPPPSAAQDIPPATPSKASPPLANATEADMAISTTPTSPPPPAAHPIPFLTTHPIDSAVISPIARTSPPAMTPFPSHPSTIVMGTPTKEERRLSSHARPLLQQATPFISHKHIRSTRVRRTPPINPLGHGVSNMASPDAIVADPSPVLGGPSVSASSPMEEGVTSPSRRMSNHAPPPTTPSQRPLAVYVGSPLAPSRLPNPNFPTTPRPVVRTSVWMSASKVMSARGLKNTPAKRRRSQQLNDTTLAVCPSIPRGTPKDVARIIASIPNPSPLDRKSQALQEDGHISRLLQEDTTPSHEKTAPSHPEAIHEDVKCEDTIHEDVGYEDTIQEDLAEEEKQSPVKTHPIEILPVETLPVEILPVETLPVETLPIETLPIETLPVEALPVETLPIDPLPEKTIAKKPALIYDEDEDGANDSLILVSAPVRRLSLALNDAPIPSAPAFPVAIEEDHQSTSPDQGLPLDEAKEDFPVQVDSTPDHSVAFTHPSSKDALKADPIQEDVAMSDDTQDAVLMDEEPITKDPPEMETAAAMEDISPSTAPQSVVDEVSVEGIIIDAPANKDDSSPALVQDTIPEEMVPADVVMEDATQEGPIECISSDAIAAAPKVAEEVAPLPMSLVGTAAAIVEEEDQGQEFIKEDLPIPPAMEKEVKVHPPEESAVSLTDDTSTWEDLSTFPTVSIVKETPDAITDPIIGVSDAQDVSLPSQAEEIVTLEDGTGIAPLPATEGVVNPTMDVSAILEGESVTPADDVAIPSDEAHPSPRDLDCTASLRTAVSKSPEIHHDPWTPSHPSTDHEVLVLEKEKEKEEKEKKAEDNLAAVEVCSISSTPCPVAATCSPIAPVVLERSTSLIGSAKTGHPASPEENPFDTGIAESGDPMEEMSTAVVMPVPMPTSALIDPSDSPVFPRQKRLRSPSPPPLPRSMLDEEASPGVPDGAVDKDQSSSLEVSSWKRFAPISSSISERPDTSPRSPMEKEEKEEEKEKEERGAPEPPADTRIIMANSGGEWLAPHPSSASRPRTTASSTKRAATVARVKRAGGDMDLGRLLRPTAASLNRARQTGEDRARSVSSTRPAISHPTSQRVRTMATPDPTLRPMAGASQEASSQGAPPSRPPATASSLSRLMQPTKASASKARERSGGARTTGPPPARSSGMSRAQDRSRDALRGIRVRAPGGGGVRKPSPVTADTKRTMAALGMLAAVRGGTPPRRAFPAGEDGPVWEPVSAGRTTESAWDHRRAPVSHEGSLRSLADRLEERAHGRRDQDEPARGTSASKSQERKQRWRG